MASDRTKLDMNPTRTDAVIKIDICFLKFKINVDLELPYRLFPTPLCFFFRSGFLFFFELDLGAVLAILGFKELQAAKD